MLHTTEQAQKIIDWRLMFFTDDEYVATHHFPVVPKIGELWKIPASEYDAKGEQVSLRILDVIYDWQGIEYDNGYLNGWYVDIKIRCRYENED